MPLVAQTGTTTTVSPYSADTLRLMALHDRLQRHSVGRDRWQVWVCEPTQGGSTRVPVDVDNVVDLLQNDIGPYFRWHSDGLYLPVFEAGGETISVAPDTTDYIDVREACIQGVTEAVLPNVPPLSGSVTDLPNGVIIVVNTEYIGNSRNRGVGLGMRFDDPCLVDESDAICQRFPLNERAVVVAGRWVVPGANQTPLLLAHEIGHTIGFPHSYAVDGGSQYDNPMDVMSNAANHLGKTEVGTIAVNLYQAGWMSSQDVVVHASGTATFALRPPGTSRHWSLRPAGSLPEMLVLKPSQRNISRGTAEEGVFVSLGARVSDGYDGELTDAARPYRRGVQVGRGQEGVEMYLIDQRSSACLGRTEGVCLSVMRRTQQVPDTSSFRTTHVLRPQRGGQRTLRQSRTFTGAQFTGTGIEAYTVQVVRRVGDSWLVRVSRANDEGPFARLGANTYREDIELLYRLNITTGCRTTGYGPNLRRYYCPSETVSRAQMAVFLVRALGEEPIPKSDPRRTFRDVSRSHWAWGYIEKLRDLGITEGCGNGRNYCPRTLTTRAHAAVFLIRALGQNEISTTTQTFSDVRRDNPRTSANERHWAHGYIERMQQMRMAVTCSIRGGLLDFCPDRKNPPRCHGPLSDQRPPRPAGTNHRLDHHNDRTARSALQSGGLQPTDIHLDPACRDRHRQNHRIRRLIWNRRRPELDDLGRQPPIGFPGRP